MLKASWFCSKCFDNFCYGFYRILVQIGPHFGSQNRLKIVRKSFWPPKDLPRTSKMPPWSLRKASKTPKVAPRGLQKVSKAAHNGLWEGAWTNAHGLVKLRDSIKLEPPKSCMMWTNWMNRLHGIRLKTKNKTTQHLFYATQYITRVSTPLAIHS